MQRKIIRLTVSGIAVFILVLVSLAGAAPQEPNDVPGILEVSEETNRAFIGQMPDLGVSFSSVREIEGLVKVKIGLRDEKFLEAAINREKRTFHICFISRDGALAKLTEEDVFTFYALNGNLRQYFSRCSPSRVDQMLAIVSSIAEHYPADEYISLTQLDTNQSVTSLCNRIGKSVTGNYTVKKTPYSEPHVLGPCAAGDCFGRCGPDCGWPPHPLIQGFTQDCVNHDLCCKKLEELGIEGPFKLWEFLPFGECGVEWISAIDDWFFAPDCNAISGKWVVKLSGTTQWAYKKEAINFTVTFSFNIYDEFDDFSMEFQGIWRDSAGRNAVLNGTVDFNNQVSGNWSFPVYMGPECGGKYAGDAHGIFTGKNNCGSLQMELFGEWGWYLSKPFCVPVIGQLIAKITASRLSLGMNGSDSVGDNEAIMIEPGNGEASPGRIGLNTEEGTENAERDKEDIIK